jgi:type IV pilus assembly protein PilV
MLCCRGMTLIEVLVALVLLCSGMLGAAAFLNEGLRLAHSAALETEALAMAGAMAAQVRANPAGIEGFVTQSETCLDDAAICDARAGAAAVLAEWQATLVRELPSGRGRVERDPSGGPLAHLVRVSWTPPAQPAADLAIAFLVPAL